MAELPSDIVSYLHHLASTQRKPAWMRSTGREQAAQCRRPPDSLWPDGPDRGKQVGDQVYFLEGLFPLESERLILPAIQTDSGLPADLHIFILRMAITCSFLMLPNRSCNRD
ncbi:MAG: hypothetical protein IPM55_17760 [Acidobacteria bacterium]|nr:hypothetical protein [Acidobacteriota bacterium]